jgi:hypothetical protein
MQKGPLSGGREFSSSGSCRGHCVHHSASIYASLTSGLADHGQAMCPNGPGRISTNFRVSVANVGSTVDQPAAWVSNDDESSIV